MTTKAINRNMSQLKREVELLRSFVVGQIGKDPEGEYRPEFVKKILKAVAEKPKYTFDSKTFLKRIAGQ